MVEKAKSQTGLVYDEQYYLKNGCGPIPYARDEPHWLRFFGMIADQIILSLSPKRVFDAGCAMGFLVESLWDRGVQAWGVDISEYAIARVRRDMSPYCSVGSLTDPCPGKFDLITCIEVLEHIPEVDARTVVGNLTTATDTILFSSTPKDLTEPTHVNVRPIMSWLRLFGEFGFHPDVLFEAQFVSPQAFLLRRAELPPPEETLVLFARLVQQRIETHERDLHVARLEQEVAASASPQAGLQQKKDAFQHEVRMRLEELSARVDEYAAKLEGQAVQHQHSTLHSDIAARLNEQGIKIERQADTLQQQANFQSQVSLAITDLKVDIDRRFLQILNSRIWRTLVAGGAFLERLPGMRGKQRGSHSAVDKNPGTSAGCVTRLDYESWVQSYDTLNDDDRIAIKRHIRTLAQQPLVSVVMPVYDTRPEFLRSALDSVLAQLYPYWELCIADDASPNPEVRAILDDYARRDRRIKLVYRHQNGHISAASNSALELATGSFIALMDHDDMLMEHALYMVAVELNEHPNADIIYSDEDKIDNQGNRWGAYFKTGWNPELFYSQNIISHLGVYRASKVREIGSFREGLEGSQDYDLALRIIQRTTADKICHIPFVLYSWRIGDGAQTFSTNNMPTAVTAARRALSDFFEDRGDKVQVIPSNLRDYNRILRFLPDTPPLVSLIVPTRDREDLLRDCIEGLLYKTSYPNLEIIVVDNGSNELETLRYLEHLRREARVQVLCIPGPFNFSRLNNLAVEKACGELIGFLNNDIRVIEPNWLREMVAQTVQPGVGAVGAKLLYPDNTVQHGGVVLGIGGVAAHAQRLLPRDAAGYIGNLQLVRNVSCVTAACMLMHKSVFEEIGGFDEVSLSVAYNDVDLCLRIREAGYAIIWTPYAELYHLESVSRGYDSASQSLSRIRQEHAYMQRRWGATLQTDPFYSPNLTLEDGSYGLAFPPRVTRPWQTLSAAKGEEGGLRHAE